MSLCFAHAYSATTRRAQRRGEGGEIYIRKKRSQSKNRQKNSGIWRGSEDRQSHVKRRGGGRTARASTGGHHPRYNPEQRGDGEDGDEGPRQPAGEHAVRVVEQPRRDRARRVLVERLGPAHAARGEVRRPARGDAGD